MSINYKVLGQANPPANTTATLYTNTTTFGAVVSTLHICNLGNTATSFQAAVRIGGASTSTQQFIAYNTPVVANDAISITIGITMANGDVLSVSSIGSYIAFTAFGSEFN